MDKLNEYMIQNLELIVVYNPIGVAQKDDFVGANFLMGKILAISDKNIIFAGPNGRTFEGIEFSGSPYDIRSDTIHKAIPASDVNPRKHSMSKLYQFSTMYGVELPFLVEAHTSVEGFKLLVNNLQSLIADRQTGYTNPIKLEKILDSVPESIGILSAARETAHGSNKNYIGSVDAKRLKFITSLCG